MNHQITMQNNAKSRLNRLIFYIALEYIAFGMLAFAVIFNQNLKSLIFAGILIFAFYLILWVELFFKRYEELYMPASNELSLKGSKWEKLAKVAFVILYFLGMEYRGSARAYFGEIIFNSLVFLIVGFLWGIHISKTWYKFKE